MKTIKLSIVLCVAFLNSNAQVNNNFAQTLIPNNAAAGINYPIGTLIPGPTAAQPQLNVYSSNSNAGSGGESFIECRQALPNAAGLGDFFDITNASGSSALFAPKITGHAFTHSGPALYVTGDVGTAINDQDVGNTPVIMFHVSKGGARLTTLGNPITVRPLYGWTNNGAMQMMMDAAGRLGIGTGAGAIASRLHVNVAGLTATTGIRFQGLIASQDPNILSVDNLGNVHTMPVPTSGITNSCSTLNFVPKVSTATGNLSCSQIFDDGNSVGINKTSGFNYTAGSGVFTAGTPATQTVRLDVTGLTRSTSFVATSDAKYKTNIKSLNNSLSSIMKLRGVEYNWKSTQYPNKQFDELKHSGFIAQELMDVLPNAVIKDQEGDYAVDYNALIPVLTGAIQEQQKQIENQQAQIEELKKLVAQNAGKTSGSTGIGQSNPSSDGYLAQNIPNPFSSNTEIKYQLPKVAQTAILGIYDLNGKQVRTYPIRTEQNSGSVIVQANDLQAGMYLYTLIIDGKAFDTKRMVLTAQ